MQSRVTLALKAGAWFFCLDMCVLLVWLSSYHTCPNFGDHLSFSYSCVGEECPRADLYEVLQRLHDGNHPVDVLVDPDRPERSLLYRHLHMPLFLMRSGVGLFCFLTGGASVVFGVYLLCGPGRKEL